MWFGMQNQMLKNQWKLVTKGNEKGLIRNRCGVRNEMDGILDDLFLVWACVALRLLWIRNGFDHLSRQATVSTWNQLECIKCVKFCWKVYVCAYVCLCKYQTFIVYRRVFLRVCSIQMNFVFYVCNCIWTCVCRRAMIIIDEIKKINKIKIRFCYIKMKRILT